jgi:hypothetical protein
VRDHPSFRHEKLGGKRVGLAFCAETLWRTMTMQDQVAEFVSREAQTKKPFVSFG